MNTLQILQSQANLPRHRAVVARFCVCLALVISLLPPRWIRRFLGLIRVGAATACTTEVSLAREAVVSVSVLCAGEGCLQRSIATALMCRMVGVWPTWCVGARTEPFQAHCWVEVDGHPVGEELTRGDFSKLIVVGPK